MPTRGSGIGAAWGSNLWGSSPQSSGGGRAQSPTTNTLYGKASVGGALGATTSTLLIVVAAEVLILVCLRHGFRHYHGG